MSLNCHTERDIEQRQQHAAMHGPIGVQVMPFDAQAGLDTICEMPSADAAQMAKEAIFLADILEFFKIDHLSGSSKAIQIHSQTAAGRSLASSSMVQPSR